jgi:prepilin-type N-terminal cleavage/methylation domain-containing protein
MSSVGRQRGYTLVELLLYLAILGVLMGSVTVFLGSALAVRVKNQSIAEVEQQGALLMDTITQAIRNADSITSPATGASGDTLTLAMASAGVNPTIFSGSSTVLGNNQDGVQDDADNSNFISATKYVAASNGTTSMLYGRVGSVVASAPNNKAQMALYSGASNPSTLLATSTEMTITANSWVAFPIPSTAITSGTTYWISYNTNGTAATQNNLRIRTGTANQSKWIAQTYGAWPANWVGTNQNMELSVYMTVFTGSGAFAQVKEASNAEVALTNSKVQLSGLTFTNLSRASTPGVVQVSFTLSRVNNSNRNEFDYQKTFTSSAALRWP